MPAAAAMLALLAWSKRTIKVVELLAIVLPGCEVLPKLYCEVMYRASCGVYNRYAMVGV